MTHQIKTYKEYQKKYEESVKNPERFWAKQAKTFTWIKPWKKVLESDFKTPDVKWFVDGKMNITVNCLDRHLEERGDETALIWEPNDPSQPFKTYTYLELYTEVCRCANMLKASGIKKGDRVCFYMPMVAELTIAVLACARIGAIHSVVFAGFSANALADRIKDSSCKMVICSDYNNRGTKNIPVKQVVDDALKMGCKSIETVIVHQNTGGKTKMKKGRDIWWHDAIVGKRKTCKPAQMDSEDVLFILYTSGSTGKPKGVVHTCGGYMVYTSYSFRNVFQYQAGDVYWCTADIGWITGHSYIIYGPLLTGATTMMFEGVPTFPDAGRFWHICEKHKVNQFYTAPTAIRALMAKGDHWPSHYDLSSLKVLGTVGEPINEEAWNWYKKEIGKDELPIVDTWWQTETGGIMIAPQTGAIDLKPGSATKPFYGIKPVLVDKKGVEIKGPGEGRLCIAQSWPGQMRTVYGDHQRFIDTYFSQFDGKYFTGDGCRRDKDGYYWITGRVDDVIIVSGHNLGTAEIESAFVAHPKVAEAAVVGYPHDIKGNGLYCYVTLNVGEKENGDLDRDLKLWVRKQIGPLATPDLIHFTPGLPKTRSGKIMRRILRKIAANEHDQLGDTTTLADPSVVESLVDNRKNI